MSTTYRWGVTRCEGIVPVDQCKHAYTHNPLSLIPKFQLQTNQGSTKKIKKLKKNFSTTKLTYPDQPWSLGSNQSPIQDQWDFLQARRCSWGHQLHRTSSRHSLDLTTTNKPQGSPRTAPEAKAYWWGDRLLGSPTAVCI